MNVFRLPERLGAFSISVAPEVYALAHRARRAGAVHRALVRRELETARAEQRSPVLAENEEFVRSALRYYRRLQNLWDGLEWEQGIAPRPETIQSRRMFLASALEWALGYHYEVRDIRKIRDEQGLRWEVRGRAWDGERPHEHRALSDPFRSDGSGAADRALMEALARAYTGALGGLSGWRVLDPGVEAPVEVPQPAPA